MTEAAEGGAGTPGAGGFGGGSNEEGSGVEAEHHPFEFTGQAGEYFRIWIVNLSLTIVTLGIYSAWAKVRTRRYFYQHTFVGGSAFEYTANPVAILIGRLIVVAFAAAYGLAGQFSPTAAVVMLIAFFLATPFLVVRSLAFNHRNSRWRNIRFKFHGTYLEAVKVFIGLPFLLIFTLGLALPYQHGRQHQFVVENTALGTTRASFPMKWTDYYGPYVAAFLVVIGGVLLAGLVMAAAGVSAGVEETNGEGTNDAAALAVIGPVMLLYFAVYGVAGAIVWVGTNNLRYNTARLPGVEFRSTLAVPAVIWLYLRCGIAVVFSLGLALPWAAVQIARYKAEHLEAVARPGAFDRFEQAEEDAHGMGAIADEAASGFEIDFGL